MHNVLKRVRTPSSNSADRLMDALGLRMMDLLWNSSGAGDHSSVRAIPIVRNRIGPGTDASFDQTRDFVPLPESLLTDLIEPLAARLGPDLVLPRTLNAHDLVLLDQNPQHRAFPAPGAVWIVSEGAGMRVRYLRLQGNRLFVVNEMTLHDAQQWHFISLQGRDILEIVRARIVWMSREMHPGLPREQGNQANESP
jgi:hypothetical protein